MISAIILVVVILALLLIYSNYYKNQMATYGDEKVVGIKEFVWPDSSFSFSYPEFEKWTPSPSTEPIEQNVVSPSGMIFGSQNIDYNPPPSMTWSGQAPRIKIIKSNRLAKLPADTPKNPSGIYYYLTIPPSTVAPGNPIYGVTFQVSEYSVDIEISYGSANVKGFSAERIAEEIVKTFKLGSGKNSIVAVELGKPFYLEDNGRASYDRATFVFHKVTLPLSRHPTTGIEQYPYDVYQVVLSDDRIKATNPSSLYTEMTLNFRVADLYQEFNIGLEKYELHFVEYKDGKGKFILDYSKGYAQ